VDAALVDARDGRGQEASSEVGAPVPGQDARADVVFDGPSPDCAVDDLKVPPDPRCGEVPPELRHGCGCTDGIGFPKCQDGVWMCEYGEPRALCRGCGGLDLGQPFLPDAGAAATD
jgi:hypothetical protein